MSKIIESEEYREQRKRLHQFMQKVNPKPSAREREKLKQQYIEARKVYEAN